MKVEYCVTQGLKIWDLGSGPLLKTENGDLSELAHSWKKGILELKITKQTHIFLWYDDLFWAAQVEKLESLGAAKAKNGVDEGGLG